MERHLWLYYAYNIDNGARAVLSACFSPIIPCVPFYFDCGRIKTKWVKANKDHIVQGSGWNITITRES